MPSGATQLDVTCLSWRNDEDIHIAGGITWVNLIDNIEFRSSDGKSAYSLSETDLTSLTFTPNFKKNQNSRQGFYEGHGASVMLQTGWITYDHASTTSPYLRNFLIFVEAKKTIVDPSGNSVTKVIKLAAPIRVHLHREIKEAWLSPLRMTVPSGASKEFTVLARFDDESTGDISRWPEKAVIGGTQYKPKWSIPANQIPPASGFTITPDGTLTATATSGKGKVALEFPSGLGAFSGKVVEAECVCDVPLGTLASKDPAICIGGNGSEYQTRKNILLLPDGFQDTKDDRELFDKITRGIVQSLNNTGNVSLQPFPLLRDSFNYWALFVPSAESGASLLTEFYRRNSSNIASFVPGPSGWDGNGTMSLSQLIGEVGLPVEIDDGPGKRADLQTKKTVWKQLYENPRIDTVTQKLYEEWLALYNRTLINNADTVFGISVNHRPHAGKTPWGATFTWLDDKRNEYDGNQKRYVGLDDFLKSVVGNVATTTNPSTNISIGTHWAKGGNDEGLVAIISRTTLFTGTANPYSPKHVVISIPGYSGQPLEKIKPVPGHGYVIDPVIGGQLPQISSNNVTSAGLSVLIHEWSHSFVHLLDEYGVTGCAEKNSEVDILECTNIQRRDSLLSAGNLDGAKLKWNWHRVRKAATVAATPQLQGTGASARVTVALLKGGSEFKINDIVRFRRRGLARMRIANSSPVAWDPAHEPYVTDRLKVTATAANQLELSIVGSITQVDLNKIGKDDVVFVPVKAKNAPTNSDPELRLVAESIAQHLTSSRGPLNAPAANPTEPCKADMPTSGTMLPSNLPALPALARMPKNRAEILGLYEGGGRANCGHYRAAGVCLMRSGGDWKKGGFEKGEFTGFAEIRRFCEVCKVSIVNSVDPTKLGALDDEYEKVYPGPERE